MDVHPKPQQPFNEQDNHLQPPPSSVGLKALEFEKESEQKPSRASKTNSWRWPQAKALSILWYVGLMTQNWLVSGQMILASVLVQLFALGMPVFYIVIFDRVFGRQNLATLDVIGVGILLILTFDLIVKMLRSYLVAYQIEWLDKITLTHLMDGIYEQLKSLKSETSIDIEAMANLVKVNQATAITLMVTGLDVALSTIVVAVLMMMHPVLAVISLVPLIPIGLLSFWNTPKAKQRSHNFQKDQRECQTKLAELSQHQEALLASNALDYQSDKLHSKLMHWIETSLNTRVDQTGGSNLQGFFMNLGSMLTLYVGAHYVLSGDITFGVYLAINMISRIVVGNVQKLLQSLVVYQESAGQREQITDVLDTHTHSEINPQNSRPLIQLKNVNGKIDCHNVEFHYPDSEQPILNNLSFSIEPGQRIVIAGKSGAGKSTLARLLQNLLSPTHGYIKLDDYNLSDWQGHNLRQHIGLALQRPGIISGTIRDNITLGNPNATNQQILDVCQWVELDDSINQAKEGLDTIVKPNGGNLSGGQIARLSLARTLIAQPSVLILDEAMAQLPPTSKINIFNTIHKQFRQSTCLFISHFIPLHQGASRILVLEEGRIVEDGSFKELADKKGLYYQLYLQGLQHGPTNNHNHNPPSGGQA